MAGTAERPNRIPWPPIVAAASILAALLLGQYVPVGWPGGMGADILQGAGFVFIIVAVVLGLAAIGAMYRARTTVRPDRAVHHLVTSGPFSFTRNPIYLATAIFITGLGLALANGWLLLAALVTALADQKLAIEREEAHLEARFGKHWRDYKKRVRRWI